MQMPKKYSIWMDAKTKQKVTVIEHCIMRPDLTPGVICRLTFDRDSIPRVYSLYSFHDGTLVLVSHDAPWVPNPELHIRDLLISNNQLLERARKAEQELKALKQR